MMAKPIRALELHYPMTQFLIMNFLLGFQSAYKWGMEAGALSGRAYNWTKKSIYKQATWQC